MSTEDEMKGFRKKGRDANNILGLDNPRAFTQRQQEILALWNPYGPNMRVKDIARVLHTDRVNVSWILHKLDTVVIPGKITELRKIKNKMRKHKKKWDKKTKKMLREAIRWPCDNCIENIEEAPIRKNYLEETEIKQVPYQKYGKIKEKF